MARVRGSTQRSGRWRRRSLRMVGVILGAVAVVIVWMMILYPAGYVRRTVLWMSSDVDDAMRFEAREFPASADPVMMESAADPSVIADLSSVFDRDDPEQYLADLDTQAFIVTRGETVIYEEYFNGFTRDSVATSFSVAKSFDSTLIGIAVSEGMIESVDQPITDYLPELLSRDPDFAAITIWDLMAMSSGIHYEEHSIPPADDAKTYYWPDLRNLALTSTVIDEPPGTRFLYNNYNPLLEGLIIERATGMTVSGYLASRVWQPMGAEFPASWSLDSDEGFEKMESGINARPIDFARFGIVFLHGGVIGGRQIVAPDWVARASAPTHDPGSDFYPEGMAATGRIGYGLHWWTVDGTHGTDFLALGNHGQLVYVSPATDIVVVRNARSYGLDPIEWMTTLYDLTTELAS